MISLFVFLLKRVSVCAAGFIVVAAWIYGADAMIMAGVPIGALLSVYKTAFWGMAPVWFARKKASAFFLLAFLSQAVSAAALLTAVFIHKHLFIGMATGLLTSATVICINAFTEKIGLTHNGWGMRLNDYAREKHSN